MGNYQKALELYEKIHVDYPENLECEKTHCQQFISFTCSHDTMCCDIYVGLAVSWIQTIAVYVSVGPMH